MKVKRWWLINASLYSNLLTIRIDRKFLAAWLTNFTRMYNPVSATAKLYVSMIANLQFYRTKIENKISNNLNVSEQ